LSSVVFLVVIPEGNLLLLLYLPLGAAATPSSLGDSPNLATPRLTQRHPNQTDFPTGLSDSPNPRPFRAFSHRKLLHSVQRNQFALSYHHSNRTLAASRFISGFLCVQPRISFAFPTEAPSMSLSFSPLKCLALLTAALATAALTGCANMVTTASETNAFSTVGTTAGMIHGGQQPVSGATVKIYAVGTAGYGSPSTLLATTTTSTTGTGSFAFQQVTSGATGPSGSSYICPTSNTQIYITANGGDTLGTNVNNNTAASFISALGPCGSAVNNFISLNEVTTVATLAALQQYFNPNTESLGYPNTTQAALGFTNGVATISNLADLNHGLAITSSTLTGTASTVSGTAVTMTPESAKVNTLADILAACINTTTSGSTNCGTLFTNAVPPASAAVTSQPGLTFATATDTVQAAYYMLVNPTENGDNGATSGKLFNLYGLAGGTASPFQPGLTAQPTDWTVGILYNASTSACTGTASGKFIFYAYLVRADANGNIWISSNGAAPENISEVSPTGVPMACVTPSSASGLYEGLTIDTVGNIWTTSHISLTVGAIYEINPTTLAVTPWTETGIVPWDVAADGSGNVFYTSASSAIHKFTSAATTAVPVASTPIGSASDAVQNYMVLDPSGDIFVADNTGTTTGPLYETYPDAVTGTNGYSTYNAGTSGNVQAQIAVDASGKVWTTQTTPANTATVLIPATPPAKATSAATAVGLAGISTPRGVAIDGAGNAWIPNGVSGGHNVAELDKNLNSLSGTGGFVKATVFPNTLRAVTIDPTGNVWIGTNATTVDTISEIVGAGVPVVTPLSAQLTAGTVAKP
jgi:hypothetical protein